MVTPAMTPDQFLRSLARQAPSPVYLFAGPETYRRRECRAALLEKALPPEDRESGYTRHDLDTMSIEEVLDDARSMSLFASNRLIWVSPAESALPRGRGAASDSDDDSKGSKDAGGAASLKSYCENPTPGTVIVFDASRFGAEGEDKAKLERVVKFYGAVPTVVEFAMPSSEEAREFARRIADGRELKLAPLLLDQLVEATAGDLERLDREIEKLSLFQQAAGRALQESDIVALVPNAGETTIFALVNAMARRDRISALRELDTLVREGEYLPLALTFLGGVFRLALAARENNLRSASDVQSHFQRQGMAMWRSRAEQVHTASAKFPAAKLEEGIDLIFRADKGMKSARPDDRLVMEDLVLRLTA
jgi:DNA polymerase III subunit delta